MAIHYVLSRDFKGEYVAPRYMVVGEEQGSTVRRVFRSKGHAERFKRKLESLPSTRKIAVVQLPED